jgi:hypothetical protein
MLAPDRRLPLVALVALILPMTSSADVIDRLRLAEAAAPERLRLRVHAAALSDGTLPAPGVVRMRRDMERQGYYFDGGPPDVVASDVVLAPTLAWDGNINGGVMRDHFVAGGLVFEAAPEVRAVGGAVAGVQGLYRTRVALKNGRLIELRGGVELGYAPTVRLGRADTQLGICLQNHLAGWSFLDICGTKAFYWRDLVEGNAEQISLEATQVLVAGASAHQLGLRALRVSGEADKQDRVAFSVSSVWTRVATQTKLTLGKDVPGTTSLRYRLEGGVSWLMLDRVFSLNLSRQELGGGAFLGVPRRDEVHEMTLAVDLRTGAELSLGLVDSRSTAAIADYRQVTLDLRFDSFR